MGLHIHACSTAGGNRECPDTWQTEDIDPETVEDGADSVVNSRDVGRFAGTDGKFVDFQ